MRWALEEDKTWSLGGEKISTDIQSSLVSMGIQMTEHERLRQRDEMFSSFRSWTVGGRRSWGLRICVAPPDSQHLQVQIPCSAVG